MNNENLIPITMRTERERREIQSRGGKACKNNPKHKLACRLRELRKKGLTKDSSKLMYDMMVNEEVSELESLTYIRKYEKLCEASNDGLKKSHLQNIFFMLKDWHKLKHGEKQKIDTTNTNLNINVNLFNDDRIKEIIGVQGSVIREDREDDVVPVSDKVLD